MWVRPGQFWTSEVESGHSSGEIVEILGTIGEEFVIRRWMKSKNTNAQTARSGDIMTIKMNSHSMGGGSSQRASYGDIVPVDYAHYTERKIVRFQVSQDSISDIGVTVKILGAAYSSSPLCTARDHRFDELNALIKGMEKPSREAERLTNWDEICAELSRDEHFLGEAEIHTDGSWAQTADTVDKIFMRVGGYLLSTHLSSRQHNYLLKERQLEK